MDNISAEHNHIIVRLASKYGQKTITDGHYQPMREDICRTWQP